jgi:hypothetical protein
MCMYSPISMCVALVTGEMRSSQSSSFVVCMDSSLLSCDICVDSAWCMALAVCVAWTHEAHSQKTLPFSGNHVRACVVTAIFVCHNDMPFGAIVQI